MNKCICCGAPSGVLLCEKCHDAVDLRELCKKIIDYVPGEGKNLLWDEIAATLDNPLNFKNMIFALTDEMESPEKEILRIRCMSGNRGSVPKTTRKWLLEIADECIQNEKTAETEKGYIMGLKLDALYKDYDYFGAEAAAEEIFGSPFLDVYAAYTLGDFYIQTRRYEKAKIILRKGMEYYPERTEVGLAEKLKEASEREMGKENGGKPPYLPNPTENRDKIRDKYIQFMDSIGIAVAMPEKGKSKKPVHKIPRDEYPAPAETRESGFRSFVAFDLETTGLNPNFDSITEIGAVRVVDGVVSEEKEFVFQELVHPYDKRIPKEVETMTGITNDMVRNAREMWEVFPDFVDFIGDDILVGFNCMGYDSRFLVRAGRYSNRIITNPYFDVMRMAKEVTGQGRISLNEISEKLNIQNPRAHRALADAITTARVYLKLLENQAGKKEETLDDFLAGLDDF